MSYDFGLIEPSTGKSVYFNSPHKMKGGTYAVGGTKEAVLNITFNYSRWYNKHGVFPDDWNGIKGMDQIKAADSIPILKKAINTLEEMTEELTTEEIKNYIKENLKGYWMPTRENAIKPLYQLLTIAEKRPDAMWKLYK